MKKILNIFLVVMLALTSLPMSLKVIEAETFESVDNEYEMYPVPQEVRYRGDEFIIRKEVNVVAESEIDQETVARLEEVLEIKGIKPSYSSKIVKGKTNILMGIHSSGEYVDKKFNAKNQLNNPSLFENIDAHVVHVEKDMITVLGKDTDSVFYGLTTLYHVFKQMDSYTIKSFVVEDYADVISRGFIEGYYGEPWSTEDRVDLMKFGGYYKANSYFYAPKDDPKHNAKWRELYNDEELANMKKLAVAGNESKTRFVYAIHPFMNSVFRFDEHYDEDFKVLTDKLQQMLDVGVRQFSILGDDAGVPGGDAQNYVRILNDLTDWIVGKQADYPGLKKIIPFVPNDYMGWGESVQIQTLKELPENIQIVMTGGKVWGEVSQKFTSTFTNNAGRGPYMWINWPVTDNSKQHLIMGGGHKFLQPNVNPKDIEGIVLNPMQQSEPSKLSIFYGAAYSWNIWSDEEEALEAWENAFSYVDHNSAIETESSLALKELSKHMINQDMDGRVVALDESIDLAPKLNEFMSKLENNTVTDEDIDLLVTEFEILEKAAQQYRNSPGNIKTRDQMIYWLNSWDNTNQAALDYLEAVRAYNNNNQSNLLNLFSSGQENFARSKTHGFSYIDHIEYAEVGVQHIVPFIETLEQFLSEIVKDSVGLGDRLKVITNIESKPEGGNEALKKLIDNSDTTHVYWKGYYPREDDYIGLEFKGETEEIYDLEVLLGISETHHDTFYNAQLEYTVDGENWVVLEDTVVNNKQTNRLYHKFDAPTAVQGFRVVNTKNLDNKWFGMRALRYNTDQIKAEPEVIKSDNWKVYQGQESNLFDSNPNTFVWYQTKSDEPKKDHALAGEFLGYDLKEVKKLDSLEITVGHNDGDKLINYTIETSNDNKNWSAIEGYDNYQGKPSGQDKLSIKLEGKEARYVRIRNLEDKHSWIKFTEFIVNKQKEDVKSSEYVYSNVEDSSLYSQKEFDKTSLISDVITLKENQFIGLKLDNIKSIRDIVLEGEIDNLTLEVSRNGIEWHSYKSQEETDARYIRLINQTKNNAEASIDKFDVYTHEVKRADFLETSIKRAENWSSEDVRLKNNGTNAFDGKLQTSMSVSGYPQKGDDIIFDLGQIRDISSIKYIIDENNKNYIRDAVFEISEELESDQWQHLFEVGDGIEVNKHDETTAKDAEYLTHDSKNPGYMFAGADNLSAQGRYLKVRFTTSYDYRFVGFSEIEINDGEYVTQEIFRDVISTSKEKPYQLASHMFDGNLKTSYTPQDKEGKFTYYISEPEDIKRIKIISNGNPSNAIVSAQLIPWNTKSLIQPKTSTIELGKLSQTISEFEIPENNLVSSVTITWSEAIPTVSQIITVNSHSNTDKTELESLLNRTVDQEQWTARSKENYKVSYAQGEEILNNPYASESMIKTAAANLKEAIESGKQRGDVDALRELIENPISNETRIYTAVSYAQYKTQVKYIIDLLEDEDNVDAEQVAKTKELINASIENLEFSKYQRELTELVLEELLLQNLNEEDYTEVSIANYKDKIAMAENLIYEDKADNSIHPEEFIQQREELRNIELISVVALNAKISEFEATEEEKYTKESYLLYSEAVAQALPLLKDGDEASIKKAIEDIEIKRKSLEKIESSLEQIINEVRSLDKNDYSTVTFNDLIEFVDSIDLEAPEEEQSVIKDQLKLKIDQLIKVVVLRDKLEEIGTIAREQYTSSSVQALDKQVENANIVLKEAITEEEVTSAMSHLDQAQSQLKKKMNITEYETILEEINKFDSDLYTKDSQAAYHQIVNKIKSVITDDLTQEAWIELVYDYEDIRVNLIERVTQKEYDEFLEGHDHLDSSDYTYESFAPYEEVLDKLLNLDLENTSKFEFEVLTDQLSSLEQKLVKIDIDFEGEIESPEIDKPVIDEGEKEQDKSPEKEESIIQENATDSKDNKEDEIELPATGKSTRTWKLISAPLLIGFGVYLLLKKKQNNKDII